MNPQATQQPLKLHPLEIRRRQAGLRASELAARCGLSVSAISGIETRRSRGKVRTLQRIAEVLGCQAGDLVEDGNAQPES